MKSLRERTQELSNQLPFMQGRTKGDLDGIKDMIITIREFGFMNDNNKEYVAFIINEDPHCFYFGGQVLTDNMRKLEADGYTEEIVKDGLPVLLGTRRSKTSNKDYTTVEFFPDDKAEDEQTAEETTKGKKK
jgi:hypothetical protein